MSGLVLVADDAGRIGAARRTRTFRRDGNIGPPRGTFARANRIAPIRTGIAIMGVTVLIAPRVPARRWLRHA